VPEKTPNIIPRFLQAEKIDNISVDPICIPTPFAVGDVFSYLIVDEKIVLIDTGHFSDDAYRVLSKNLKKHGLDVRDIDEIWLTHGHPDHYGQALRLADQSGAVVYGHPNERANFAANENGDLFEEFFAKHHVPENFTAQMLDQLDWLQQFQQAIEPEWISDGDQLSSGVLDVEVHLTPGHAPGHVSFVSDEGLIFSGDLLLGHISTNALINFNPQTGRRNKSLLQYRESLQWIRNFEGTVLPGHGEKITDISAVADHHLNDHEQRYQKIQQLLQKEPMSLLDIAYAMFPDPIKNGAMFLVLSEVLGYLDWGIEEEVIYLDESEMTYYRE